MTEDRGRGREQRGRAQSTETETETDAEAQRQRQKRRRRQRHRQRQRHRGRGVRIYDIPQQFDLHVGASIGFAQVGRASARQKFWRATVRPRIYTKHDV